MFDAKLVDKLKTHIFLFNIFIFFKNRAIYKIMWKNIVERGRSEMAIWRIACRVPKATNAHSEYVILIAFPLQLLHEHASMLRYTIMVCTAKLHLGCVTTLFQLYRLMR
jgi:hypothetical protein